MSGPTSHIFVDANIAQSTTDPARHPTSIACLRFVLMLAEATSVTGAAMTPALMGEWRSHASRYMAGWLARMESRGRIRHEPDRQVRDLRTAVAAVQDEGVRAALEKDLHISEAAIWHGLPVASQDEKQRKFLAGLAREYELAGRVQWLNPVLCSDGWDEWLKSGCVERDVFTCVAS